MVVDIKDLEAWMPKSLDDIIRKNREHFQLYDSTEEELAALEQTREIVGSPTGTLSSWGFITLRGPKASYVHLVGIHIEKQCDWMTSPILAVSPDRQQAWTRSGSRYVLSGPRTTEHSLSNICAVLNTWGHGPQLGVPEFFF